MSQADTLRIKRLESEMVALGARVGAMEKGLGELATSAQATGDLNEAARGLMAQVKRAPLSLRKGGSDG